MVEDNFDDASCLQSKENWRIDDLMTNNLKIYQREGGYCFGTDSVLLANFANAKKTSKVLDLGSGSGIVGLLLAGKYGAKECTLVEIQSQLARMSIKSIELNRLDDRMRVLNIPMQKLTEHFPLHTFDLVVANPPYTKMGDGEINNCDEIALCRHEVGITLKELIKTASDMVRFGGRVCLVHQAERLAEIFEHMHTFKIAPKRLRLVEGRADKAPTLCLVEGGYGMKSGLKILTNLTLYDHNGLETEELKQIYGRQTY